MMKGANELWIFPFFGLYVRCLHFLANFVR